MIEIEVFDDGLDRLLHHMIEIGGDDAAGRLCRGLELEYAPLQLSVNRQELVHSFAKRGRGRPGGQLGRCLLKRLIER